jgi:transposase InsO family protein
MSASSYYYKPKVDPEVRELKDADLRDSIEQIQMEFPRHGYRRVNALLRRKGFRINTKRIRRVMREYGLFAEVKKAYKVATTDSRHGYRIYPNLARDVEVLEPNQLWVGDITYIRIATCFVYLAVVLDVYSRKVIGWAVARHMKKELCIEALKMAIEARKPKAGCIHHSDRGVQYASNEYIKLLDDNEFCISMSRKGNPYDNAFAESFMKTLKYEEVLLNDYETFNDVLERLPRFIEDVYNKRRLHSSLGYKTPEEFEQEYNEKQADKSTLN